MDSNGTWDRQAIPLYCIRTEASLAVRDLDLMVGTAETIGKLIGRSDDYAGLGDDLQNAAAQLEREGEEYIAEAETLNDKLVGWEMVDAAAKLVRLSETAIREHRRSEIADHARATLSAPASAVMAALAWDAASRDRSAA